jgi:hypothetical protein
MWLRANMANPLFLGLNNGEGERWGAFPLFVALLLSFTSHAYYLYLKLGSPVSEVPGWIRNFNEHVDLINWTKDNIQPNNVVVTHNPALVYLLTGLKSVTFDDPAARWKTWDNLGVRYYIRTTAMPLPDRDPAESRYNVMYRTNGRLKMRVVDLGSPGSRPIWGRP